MGLRAVQPLQLALVVRPVPGATSFPLQLQTDPLDAAFRTHVPLHARTPPYTPLHPLNIPLQALRYVSFPLQTLSKSAKIIPVMLMGRLLNGKTYPCVEFVEAGLISLGVSLFSFSEKTKEGQHGQSAVLAVPQPRCPGLPGRTHQAPGCAPHSSGAPQPLRHQWQRMVLPAARAKVADLSVLTIQEGGSETQLLGLLMLALYVVADSFTSQWQSRVYREHPTVDQFQAMFAVNTWSILMTLGAPLAPDPNPKAQPQPQPQPELNPNPDPKP